MDVDEPGPVQTGPRTVVPVIQSLPVGFVSLDQSRRVTRVNAAGEQILGSPANELVGREVWTVFPEARTAFEPVFESVLASGQPAAFDAWYPRIGVCFEFRVQSTPDGGISCYVVDVTARKQVELRADKIASGARLVADVAAALASTLDVEANMGRLAQLVLPQLGSWSIVTLVDEDGTPTDTSSWHVDPARRDDVARYAAVRVAALPGTLAERSLQSGEPVVLKRNAHRLIRARLADAEARARFDVLAPTAAAVLPMIARGRTVGGLSVYADVEWTEDEFELAKDIAARAALSIDNSLAYERVRLARADAEAARADAERANERLALLARVSEALTGMGDPDAAVGRLARLVVPQLADWSLVTIADEDGGLRDIGVAHRDPTREREVAAYAARRSVMLTDTSPLVTAMRTREPVVLAAISDERIRTSQADPAMAEIVRKLTPHGLAVIPLTARGRVFGALTLVTTPERGSHTAEEISTALEVAQRAGPVLDSARAAHRARRLGESVQRSLLAVPASGPGLEICTRYRPAQLDNDVGGDWYDHFDLADGSTVVTIGDVMGHDTAAIAAMAQLRTFMRATAWTGRHSPAEVLGDTDSASRKLGPGTFATAVTGELGRAHADGSVVLRWSNAGHLPPAVLARDGSVSYLRHDTRDVPLGVLAGAVRRDHTATLPAGSVLLLYTDGLIERRDSDLDAGLCELAAALSALCDLDLDALLDGLLAEMSRGGPHQDDIALLAVRIADPTGSRAPIERARADDFVVTLPSDATASSAARDQVAALAYDLPVELAADASLLASELVSNALRHGRAPFTLHIRQLPAGLRVAVGDHEPTVPAPTNQFPPDSQPSGRGMIIIEALASEWGVTEQPGGKSVWFTIQQD